MTQNRANLLREAIRTALNNSGLDATSASRRLNRGKDYIRDFLDGRKETLPFEALSQLEAVTNIEPSSLVRILHPSDTAILAATIRAGDKGTVIDQFYSPGKIPLLYYNDALDGSMSASQMAVSETHDPGFTPFYARPYAIVVEGDAMEPAYEAGDIIYTADELGLRKNTDVVLYKMGEEGTRAEASAETVIIRRLLSYDSESWLVRQFNPLRDERLPRGRWKEVRRIVGRKLRP